MINKIRVIGATFLIALIFACSPKPVHAQLTDGQAAVIGGLIGYSIGKDRRETQYVPVYPGYGYHYVPQAPVMIHPSQVQGYNRVDHGYCAVYTNEMYYQCLGNLQRNRNEAAYHRGLYGR